MLAALVLAALGGVCGFGWLVVGLAALLAGRGWHAVRPVAAPGLVLRGLGVAHRAEGLPPALAQGAGWYVAALVLLGAAGAVAALAWRRLARGSSGVGRARSGGHSGGGWGTARDAAPLVVGGAAPGRVVLGRSAGRLVATEPGHSLLVMGPTQSGKTSGLVVPAILEWRGPVVATSVKGDLLDATLAARRRRGTVQVFDPAGVSAQEASGWSPLAEARAWLGARRVAAALCSVARVGTGLEDGAFWYALAEKLLAPLLLAAASTGASMADVVRWVDTEDVEEVVAALEGAGETEALRSFLASIGRDDRQRSSVYATLETVLAAYADPVVARSAASSEIDPGAFVAAGREDTCYLLAPAHEQERLQPIFVALLRGFVDAAVTRAASRKAALDPPLLLVLDEAANVAPFGGLDGLAATAAAHGVQLVTVWQDLAQVEARYGARAGTVVNNHRAKVLCSGVSDPATLERVSALIGEEEHKATTHSVDAAGSWSRAESMQVRRVAPGDALRRLPPGEAVLVYGHLPPLHLRLRPFYQDRHLRRLAAESG